MGLPLLAIGAAVRALAPLAKETFITMGGVGTAAVVHQSQLNKKSSANLGRVAGGGQFLGVSGNPVKIKETPLYVSKLKPLFSESDGGDQAPKLPSEGTNGTPNKPSGGGGPDDGPNAAAGAVILAAGTFFVNEMVENDSGAGLLGHASEYFFDPIKYKNNTKINYKTREGVDSNGDYYVKDNTLFELSGSILAKKVIVESGSRLQMVGGGEILYYDDSGRRKPGDLVVAKGASVRIGNSGEIGDLYSSGDLLVGRWAELGDSSRVVIDGGNAKIFDRVNVVENDGGDVSLHGAVRRVFTHDGVTNVHNTIGNLRSYGGVTVIRNVVLNVRVSGGKVIVKSGAEIRGELQVEEGGGVVLLEPGSRLKGHLINNEEERKFLAP